MLPPQTTPIPNRGRGEVRESLRAMQPRDMRHNRNASNLSRIGGLESSPRACSQSGLEGTESSAAELPAGPADESPTAQTPDDKYPKPSATLSGASA